MKTDSTKTDPMKTVNPVTGETIKEYKETGAAELDTIVEAAVKAQKKWAENNFEERAVFLRNAAELLRKNKEKLGRLMTLEMGKPLAQSYGEVEKCAWVCDYYADNAAAFLSDEKIETDAGNSFVTFKPLGIVLSIMPWNFPYWQFFRFAAPALMAGNGVILKHSENTTGCALEIEKLMHEAGYPETLLRTVIVSNQNMQPLIQHPGVAAVTLTGSTRAGRKVASQAGEALKKTVLELGGSDPYIILGDADIKKAAATCVTSRLINSGQSCIAAKRFIVVDTVYEEFVAEFKKQMEQRIMGDSLKDDTDVGPLARYDLRDELHRQVRESVEKGAVLTLGGEIPDLPGAFYPPTILENVQKGMPAYSEELFGPVAGITRVKDEHEAIEVANDSVYGLGAAIFSENIQRAEYLAANRLEAGSCFVNTFVKSDPRLPFGGIKHSGYGRELGIFGIYEFVNTKTVYIA